jgi:DNA-directed RNA polymerase specialized sigma24 family protein
LRYRVAQREAWRLERLRLDGDEHGFNPLYTVEAEVTGTALSPLEEVEIRNDVGDALAIVAKLSPRLQRVALLRALGHTYREIGELTGDSPACAYKVSRQAHDRMRALVEERTRVVARSSNGHGVERRWRWMTFARSQVLRASSP